MELESCLVSVGLLVVLVASGVVCEGRLQHDGSLHSKLVERMDNTQRQLLDVTKALRTLDRDISKALMNCLDRDDSSLCKALNGELGPKHPDDRNLLGSKEKRSATEDPLLTEHRRFYRELFRKQAMANHLLGILKGANNILKHERKRTCNLNLGFHCETEEISDFADVYDFLSSENSPGKKRSVRSVP